MPNTVQAYIIIDQHTEYYCQVSKLKSIITKHDDGSDDGGTSGRDQKCDFQEGCHHAFAHIFDQDLMAVRGGRKYIGYLMPIAAQAHVVIYQQVCPF